MRAVRPLIKTLKGMLTVSFIGGCRLAPVSHDTDGGEHYGPDASVNDGSSRDAVAEADASDAGEPDAADAAATD
jgi:hypothetical protein